MNTSLFFTAIMRSFNKLPVRFSAIAILPLLSLLATSCAPSAYNNNGSLGFFGVIYLILAIYAVISLIKQDWSIGKKIIWGIIIWFFPVFGSIIYLLFSGRSN